jgi:G3E family GTPase
LTKLDNFLQDTLWSTAVPPTAARDDATQVDKSGPVKNSATSDEAEQPEVLRTKGLIRMRDGREYVLQGVTDVFEMKEIPTSGDGIGNEGGKVVFIGKNVDERLRDRLLAAVLG